MRREREPLLFECDHAPRFEPMAMLRPAERSSRVALAMVLGLCLVLGAAEGGGPVGGGEPGRPGGAVLRQAAVGDGALERMIREEIARAAAHGDPLPGDTGQGEDGWRAPWVDTAAEALPARAEERALWVADVRLERLLDEPSDGSLGPLHHTCHPVCCPWTLE